MDSQSEAAGMPHAEIIDQQADHITLRLPDARLITVQFGQGKPVTATAEDDGPEAPDAFWWNGRRYEDMPQQAWRLINFLWRQPSSEARFARLAEPVWLDPEATVTADNVGTVRKVANRWFSANAIPYTVTLKCEQQGYRPKRRGRKCQDKTRLPAMDGVVRLREQPV